MPNIFPNRFTELRERNGLTQAQLGNILGVSGKYVGMIERGEKPVDEKSSLGLLFAIQEDLERVGMPPAQNSQPVKEEVSQYGNACRMIPVYGWAHAGQAEAYEELQGDWQYKVPTESRDPHAFAMELEGDSMVAERGLSFTPRDMIVVQPSEAAYSGCFVVAKFRDGGVIFRQYEVAGDTISLVPLNPRYDATKHHVDEFSWIYPVWGRWTQIWRK